MRKLVLIGGGGHCKSVLDAALRTNIYSEIVITDSMLEKGTKILGCQVVGDDSIFFQLIKEGFAEAFITVGSIEHAMRRKHLADMAGDCGFRFPSIIDPSAVVSESIQIGEGTYIGKSAIVNADVKIGRHCIINTGCVIEHECRIDDFTHVSVGAILCGNVRIGTESFVGAGSTVIQGIEIGDKTIIGAGSTVLASVGDNRKVHGIVKENGL